PGARLRLLVSRALRSPLCPYTTLFRSAAGVAHGVDQLIEHDRGLLLAAGYRGLVADGVDAAIGSVVPECLGDLLGGVAVIEVDRLGTDVPGDVQAMADVVNDEHATGPAQQRGVGGHLSDGAGTVDGDGVTRLHARQ